MPEMRVGLTGGRGVLGRRLTRALGERGHRVDLFAGDVRDGKAVRAFVSGLDWVVHAAAVVPVGEVDADPALAVSVNVVGTAQVAAAVRDRGGCRVAYISTSHVYRSQDEPLSERSPIGPPSLYGLTKRQGEEWVLRLCESSLILRLFSYFDAHQAQSYVVPGLAAQLRGAPRGGSLALAGAQTRRDISDARWLAERCADLIDVEAAGAVNVCTGQGCSIAEIAAALAGVLGRGDVLIEAREDGPATSLVGDQSRLKALLGAVPAFALEPALADFAAQRAGEAQ